MKAVMRLAMGIVTAGLMLAAPPVRAQDTPADANQAESNQIGPRELQNFNLQGTVTRPAETQPAQPPATPAAPPSRPPAGDAAQTRPPAPTSSSATPSAAASAPVVADRPAADSATARQARATRDAPTASSVTMRLPPLGDSTSGAANQPGFAAAPSVRSKADPIGWLMIAVVLLGGVAFYLWRNRQREAFAGVPDIFERAAAPAPVPRPAPPPAPPVPPRTPVADDPIGLVSTRLRPWLDLAFRPTSCVIDDDNVVIEFELGLFNSGNTPARAILVEASYFNAGPTQDQEIARFFANPVGEGGRAISLAPLKSMVIRNRIVTPRENVREFEVGGRRVFVPLVGFNALYRWGSGEGQTSSSFMLGRDTGGDKLAPFRLDMVGREFHRVKQRALPTAMRN